jgi:hypothetical protein
LKYNEFDIRNIEFILFSSFSLLSLTLMKLLLFTFIFTAILAGVQCLPGFFMQDEVEAYMGDSTKLITKCDKQPDLLT